MKKKFVKTAATCGLCLSLLVSGATVSAAFDGGMRDPGNGQMFSRQQSTNVAYATSPGTIAEGTTTNAASSLQADETNATRITMTDENNTVKISESGTYVISGTCTDGNITVKKNTTGVVLILKDLDLTSKTGATLSVNKGATAKIIVSGSVKLTDAENPDDENSADADVADAFDGAAIKIKDGANACITGNGTLTLNGVAKNGIKVSGDSEDGYGSLVIDGATIQITAANDGINASYDLAILSGNITVSAGDDGIHAERILTIGAEGSSPTVTVSKSYEGIEATVVNIAGGTVSVTASDDGVNAANSDGLFRDTLDYSINITGGSVTVNAGFDGLDSNGNVNLIAGSATIRSANNGGDAGIDYDGSLYVSDTFALNNASGVAGPDGMGGAPGQMAGQQPGQRGENGEQGQMMPPAQDQNGRQGQMAPPTQGQNAQQGQMMPPAQAQENQQEQLTPPTQEQNAQPAQPETDAQQNENVRKEPLKVVPTTQNLTVDGEKKETEIYNINGNNYFKLRDVAMLLNNTGVQFSITYDAASQTILITTGKAYTPQGGELQTGQDRSASCVKSAQALVINGQPVELTAYNLGGNNFFQLRELGSALGFGVDYDDATRTILVTSR